MSEKAIPRTQHDSQHNWRNIIDLGVKELVADKPETSSRVLLRVHRGFDRQTGARAISASPTEGIVRFAKNFPAENENAKPRYAVFSPSGASESRDVLYFCNYVFSSKLSRGKLALDAGCGYGAGTVQLAKDGAMFVLGLDVRADEVRNAHRRYGHVNNLAFIVADLHELPIKSKAIGACVSVEVIEHIERPWQFLNEISRILKTDGTLILTTPNKHDSSPGLRLPTWVFHIKEYYPDELEEYLKDHFRCVQVSGNRILNRAAQIERRKNLYSWRYRLIREFSQHEPFRVLGRRLLQAPRELQRIYAGGRKSPLQLADIEISDDLDGCYDLVALCSEPTN